MRSSERAKYSGTNLPQLYPVKHQRTDFMQVANQVKCMQTLTLYAVQLYKEAIIKVDKLNTVMIRSFAFKDITVVLPS